VEKKEKKEEQRNRRNRNNSDGESGDIGSPAIEEQGEISMSFLPSSSSFSFFPRLFLLSFSWFIAKVLFAVLDCFPIVFDVPFSGETQFSNYRDLFSPGLVLLWIWNPVHDNPRFITKLAD
jgi:hypothetical protein